MNAKIAAYKSHEDAINDLKVLKNHHFSMKHVSLVGRAEVVDDHLHIKSLDKIANVPLFLGVGGGTILGVLTGMGAFAIPGFGIIYGAGAIIGAIAGLDVGLISGGIATLLATIGVKDDQIVKFKEHVNEGKFFIVVNGPAEEIEKAEHILAADGNSLEVF